MPTLGLVIIYVLSSMPNVEYCTKCWEPTLTECEKYFTTRRNAHVQIILHQVVDVHESSRSQLPCLKPHPDLRAAHVRLVIVILVTELTFNNAPKLPEGICVIDS